MMIRSGAWVNLMITPVGAGEPGPRVPRDARDNPPVGAGPPTMIGGRFGFRANDGGAVSARSEPGLRAPQSRTREAQ
ncbi:hypothetical protein Nm8I071_31600 [Nonomuraea sp. TT08I-71]|nr:hypothetical protein Nm8I071_31600 [Nonomuraea sp. TT08I-71]